MNHIPLYTMLKSEVSDDTTDLTESEKQQLVQAIGSIDKYGAELIYCIIRSYDFDKGGNNIIPFNGKIQKSGLRFELDNFDIALKRMLAKYIEKHDATQKNEII